jgi:hypothetical protein
MDPVSEALTGHAGKPFAAPCREGARHRLDRTPTDFSIVRTLLPALLELTVQFGLKLTQVGDHRCTDPARIE